MEREIVLDTETTGFEPREGHRVIEIGCVELINRLPTGKTFHKYLNPLRDVPEAAVRVHGLTSDFLKDKPLFKDVVDEFLEFIGDSKLIIHNAQFDTKFLNAELTHAKRKNIRDEQVFCTLIHARQKFPGAQNSLDALCKRFNIENSHRTKHGALLDSEILAEVYLELMGGKQVAMEISAKEEVITVTQNDDDNLVNQSARSHQAKVIELSAEEIEKHKKIAEKIPNSLWKEFYNSNS